jgi:hypothetical protein
MDRPAPPPFEGRGVDRGPAIVEVTSNQYLDVVIYIGWTGAWHRLGTVPGLATSARLTVPAVAGPLPGRYTLRVHAIGASPGSDYYSGTINLGPGDVVDLRVASDLRLSSWSIKPEQGADGDSRSP